MGLSIFRGNERHYGDHNIMASEIDEREDSMLDNHRTSLLDYIEERNRTLNKVIDNYIFYALCHCCVRTSHN